MSAASPPGTPPPGAAPASSGAAPAAAADAPARPDRRAALQLVLVGLLVLVVLLLSVSRVVLPRTTSACGRLRHIPIADTALANDEVRLETPAGRTWASIALDVRLEPQESVQLVVDRTGGRDVVLRLSRVASLPTAALSFDDGVLVGKHALELPAALAAGDWGRVVLERRPGAVAAVLPGDVRVDLATTGDDAPLEVTLFPPSSLRLHGRVRVADVRLDDGRLLPASRAALATEALVHPLALAIYAGVLTALGRRRLDRLGRRLAPHQRAVEPDAVTVWLVTVIVLLAMLGMVRQFESFNTYKPKARWMFRVLMTLLLGWSVLFLAGRDVVLRRFASLRGRGLLRVRWLPVLYVVVMAVLATGFLSLTFLLQVRVVSTSELARDEPQATVRIAAFGGSTTRGYPFEQGWPLAFPTLLEHELEAAGHAAIVWNLAADGAEFGSIERELAAALPALRPTHVVFNTVLNNASGSVAGFAEKATRLVATARAAGARVLLVKEPTIEPIYRIGRWSSVEEYYGALDALAAPPDVVVVDPLPTLIAHREELLLMDDIHWAPRGHRLMAEILRDALLADLRPPPG